MKKLQFTFTPCVFVSNFTPLLVVLQTPLNAELLLDEYKMWNILSVNLAPNMCEDSFEVLEELIEDFAYESECEEYLYIYIADSFVCKELIERLCKREYKTIFYNYKPQALKSQTQSLSSILDILEHEGV